jgi:mRNA-degrading endonuclease YafQ of YafQ-DinJ toxin-antitoxin module
MKRTLVPSQAFTRRVKRLLKREPHAADALRVALGRLAEDSFDSRLETHKLKGELAGSWACSADYNLRIIFEFVQHEGAEAVLLQDVGTHDEVY